MSVKGRKNRKPVQTRAFCWRMNEADWQMLNDIQKVHLCAKQELMRRMLHAEYRRIFEDGTDENEAENGAKG